MPKNKYYSLLTNNSRMRFSTVVFTLLFLFISYCSAGDEPENISKHTISGKVTDKSNGEGLTPLPFICPKCGSRRLCREERDITFSQDVLAVCEYPDGQPVVALRYLRWLDGGLTHRYCCSQGHELAKEDGSPVENKLELVEWLKANQSVNKG